MRTLVRFVVDVPVTLSSQTMLSVTITFVIVMSMMSVMDDFALVAIMPDRAVLNCMSMLTSMSVMRATSENRMQQHRGQRQNAGQRAKHESSRSPETPALSVYVTAEDRQKSDYPLTVNAVNSDS